MVDGIEGFGKIVMHKEGNFIVIHAFSDVTCEFYKGSLCIVSLAQARLLARERLISFEVICHLFGNDGVKRFSKMAAINNWTIVVSSLRYRFF